MTHNFTFATSTRVQGALTGLNPLILLMFMPTEQEQTAPIEINDRLHAYENKWVALDADYQILASADHLTDLLDILSPEQKDEPPTFVQVLPHNMSFVSRAAA